MYESFADPDCYPGSDVLKNLPGIRVAADLERFETVITAQRARERFPAGRLDAAHYQAVHHHLFQDVYPWAGKYRTVRIAKGGSMFCYPENISGEVQRLFSRFEAMDSLRGRSADQFADEAAHFLGDLNAIHAFRDGNGRTQLAFMAIVGESAGHPLVLARLVPGAFMAAMIASFRGDERPLAGQLRSLL